MFVAMVWNSSESSYYVVKIRGLGMLCFSEISLPYNALLNPQIE